MRSLAASCLCLSLSLSSSAFGQTTGVSVDSFHVIKTSPGIVNIELSISNDGSMGTVCLGPLAKSKDGSVQSETFNPVVIPVGQQLTLFAQVFRPHGLNKHITDDLIIMVYPCKKKPVLMRKLDWQYVWPEIIASTARSDSKTSMQDDSATTNLWWVVSQNLKQEDFSALDLLLENWNNPKQRAENGAWKLDRFRSVLWNHSGQGRNWKEGLERIQRWRKFNPKSTGAAIAEATYWIVYAWNIRGGEYNPSTDPVAMRVFGERMKRAEQVLKVSKGFASSNPLWYVTYMTIATDTKRDIRFTAKLFAEGIHKHPHFMSLHLSMANYWSPVNGGKADWQKIDEVIGNAVVLTATTDGISNYARLYRRIDARQRLEFKLFQDSRASWPKMRDSFNELIKRYPSLDNINEFASYACQAEDKDTYLRLRAQIIDSIWPHMWRNNYSPDMCDHKFMLYS